MKPLAYTKNGLTYEFAPLPDMTQADIEKCVPELKPKKPVKDKTVKLKKEK